MREIIRFATRADLDAVTAVEAACFPPAEAAKREDFEKRLAVYPDRFWVLERDGEIIAFLNGMTTDEQDLRDEMYENASLHRENGRWQMIFGVDTHPGYRRQGCAAKLMRRAKEDSRARNCRGLVLTCKENLVPFYEQFGYVNEGVSGSVHGGVVWYQMRLTLEEPEDAARLEQLYREFATNPQAPVKLKTALAGFFLERNEERQTAYGAYLRRRIRPALEALIAENAVEKIEQIQWLGWIDEGVLDAALRMAREQGKTEILVSLLQMKQDNFGYRDRDFSL